MGYELAQLSILAVFALYLTRKSPGTLSVLVLAALTPLIVGDYEAGVLRRLRAGYLGKYLGFLASSVHHTDLQHFCGNIVVTAVLLHLDGDYSVPCTVLYASVALGLPLLVIYTTDFYWPLCGRGVSYFTFNVFGYKTAAGAAKRDYKKLFLFNAVWAAAYMFDRLSKMRVAHTVHVAGFLAGLLCEAYTLLGATRRKAVSLET